MSKILNPRSILLCCILLALPWAVSAQAQRDYLIIVGSTTVAPFGAKVVERVVAEHELEMPMMQPTGTGGGMMLFCGGVFVLQYRGRRNQSV